MRKTRARKNNRHTDNRQKDRQTDSTDSTDSTDQEIVLFSIETKREGQHNTLCQ
jgi:hypothetical protein